MDENSCQQPEKRKKRKKRKMQPERRKNIRKTAIRFLCS